MFFSFSSCCFLSVFSLLCRKVWILVSLCLRLSCLVGEKIEWIVFFLQCMDFFYFDPLCKYYLRAIVVSVWICIVLQLCLSFVSLHSAGFGFELELYGIWISCIYFRFFVELGTGSLEFGFKFQLCYFIWIIVRISDAITLRSLLICKLLPNLRSEIW